MERLMNRVLWLAILGLGSLLAMTSEVRAQTYIGFVYPAGGQRGTTFEVKLGGQRLDGVTGAIVSGKGVQVKLVEYFRKMSNQDMQLLRAQLKELKQKSTKQDAATRELASRIQTRVSSWVNRPACGSLSSLVFIKVTVAPDAEPGEREIRLVTQRGLSNPMAFHVGQVPEVSRKPMKTCTFQVLGKEHLGQRKRPADEEEVRITVPCTMNGQIASGEVNRYRFKARKGQGLVISTAARQLVPYIADAVPGWFQPVLTLCDADGNEVAFNDDFRFKPDPTLFYDVPKDGEYLLTIADAIYRGREDFVYRITVGEAPFVTSVFPLGGRVGEVAKIKMEGWNLEQAKLAPPPKNAPAGVHQLVARKKGLVSNAVPFALDTLPECFDKESNNDVSHAQKVKLPIIVNGRADRPDDWDVFQFTGRAGETIVTEVHARRLDSPMDSIVKITDAKGRLLGFNDDHSDAAIGLNTHHADSHLTVKLPADGAYYVHLGDTARNGGKEYAYRLRISKPRPDFELRVVPSSVIVRSKGSGAVTVWAIRKDGYNGPIKVQVKDAPAGVLSSPITMKAGVEKVRLTVKTTLKDAKPPVGISVEGSAKIQDRTVAHRAVPADDRMQAFLWRHLVPALEFQALVYNPSYKPPPARVAPELPVKKQPTTAPATPAKAPKFTKKQVIGRKRQLLRLYMEGLFTDKFYLRELAKLEAAG
jgi:hypothetical protein